MNLSFIYRQLLEQVPDLSENSKQKNAAHAAKAFELLCSGYSMDLSKICQDELFQTHCSSLVVVRDIDFISLCEHHLLPSIGKCHIAYIPNGQVLGFGAIGQIVKMFSRRLQLQETLTTQIAQALLSATLAKGVAVMMEAKHLCAALESMDSLHQQMVTRCFLGSLKSSEFSFNF